ncbi:MAG: helix-turn-helix domain-containing protein [Terriglobales bacterium]
MEIAKQIEMAELLVKGLGTAVLTLRLRLGMSQDELCRLTGLNKSLIVRLEHGLMDIEILTLQKLSVALRVSPGELMEMAEAEVGMVRTPA